MTSAWISVALWLPAVFALVTLFVTWIYFDLRANWPYIAPRKGHLYRCSACRRVYVEPRRVPISRCPACDHLNEAPGR